MPIFALPAASLTGTIDSARIPTLLIADIGNIPSIDHDALTNFVADEHVAHSGVSITAGFGLKGGGNIASTRDLAIDSAEFLTYYESMLRHDNLTGFVADEHVAHSGVSITAGFGLKGGGSIASTRDLAIDSAELLTYYEPIIRHDNLSGFVANEHIDHTSVSITAGFGLKGGGTIALTRDLAIDSAELYSLYKHDDFSDFVADEHVAHTGVSIVAGKGLTGGGNIAWGKKKQKEITSKADFGSIKRRTATTDAYMVEAGMLDPTTFEKKYGISADRWLRLPDYPTDQSSLDSPVFTKNVSYESAFDYNKFGSPQYGLRTSEIAYNMSMEDELSSLEGISDASNPVVLNNQSSQKNANSQIEHSAIATRGNPLKEGTYLSPYSV